MSQPPADAPAGTPQLQRATKNGPAGAIAHDQPGRALSPSLSTRDTHAQSSRLSVSRSTTSDHANGTSTSPSRARSSTTEDRVKCYPEAPGGRRTAAVLAPS